MTSSFQTIVGKERDKIPDISATNYQRTEPDLTEAVNDQITRNQQDVVDFYNQMAEIQKTIAETPLANLQSLASFSQSAGRAIEIFKKNKETQELFEQSNEFLDKGRGNELITKEGSYELENAKFNNELLNENSDASLDFLRLRTVETPTDVGIKQLLRNFNTTYYGSRIQFINENGGQDILSSVEFINLHNAADELMVTALLFEAEKIGIDTNSKEFKKAFFKTIYPDIVKRRNNNIETWKGNANRNFNKLNQKQTRNIIIDYLEPYTGNNKLDVDVMQLVETIKFKIPEVKTNRDAIEYLFSEVMEITKLDERRLDLHHLDYLFSDAIFKHSASGDLTTIEDGDFTFKDNLNNIIQQAKISRAIDIENTNKANITLANQKYNEELKNYPQGMPPQIEKQLIQDLEKEFPGFNGVTDLKVKGFSSGGEYSNAGLPDDDLDVKQRLTNFAKGDEPELSVDKFFEVDKAYGDYKLLYDNLTGAGVEPEEAAKVAYNRVEKNLSKGVYEESKIEALKGRAIQPADINNDNQALRADPQTYINNNETNSIAEKIALREHKKHILNPSLFPFPNYFNGVVKGTDYNAQEFAEDRFTATGGYDSLGNIKHRFVANKDGIMVDSQYGLTKEELNQFEVHPHLTKTFVKLVENKDLAEKVIEGFKKDGNTVGTYQPAFGVEAKNGDTKTVGELLIYANRGADNFGVFGFTAAEFIEAVESGVISKESLFDLPTQIEMMFELMRQRANRTNSITGAIIQAEFGGERTIFVGDEKEQKWNRLIDLEPGVVDIILSTFPDLRKTPMNQFQNLTAGVVLEIEKLIQEQLEKEKTEGYLSEEEKKEKIVEMTGTKDKEKQKRILEGKSTEAFGGLPG